MMLTISQGICPQPPPVKRFPGVHVKPDTAGWQEDCLQLNIYIPAGKSPPASGWPVFFFIHGGFLQWGQANESPAAIAPLLSETAFEAIVVIPSYRLNLFGFLSSEELQAEAKKDGEAAGNMGFWDQRLALEWTGKQIGNFGGDVNNITVGGYSAGAHSAFHQLAHELYFVPDAEAVIKRVACWSNSPGVQPRTASDHQKQFDELLAALDIDKTKSGEKELKALRDLDWEKLVAIQEKLRISEFRATTDNAFVPASLMANISKGDFGRRMKERGIKFMNGECRDEHHLYRAWRTPRNSFNAIRDRLIADYPTDVVDKLLNYYCGESDRTRGKPDGYRDWPELFGHIYADMQVHHLERGFQNALHKAGLAPGKDIFRYRFEWRAKCIDDMFQREWGVTHATDMSIWFWGLDYDNGRGLTDKDKAVIHPWNAAFAAFVKGENPQWGTDRGVEYVKRLRSDGEIDIWKDDRWRAGLTVWNMVNGSNSAIKAKV